MERHPLQRRERLEPPPSVPTARHFCIREVGVLAEQGVLDRARMLLARRAQREPRAPDAFLDAIRLELTVPGSGSAWQAWLARALESGVEIADRLGSVVPERELAQGLIEIAPGTLLRQASRGAALDLVRLRASLLLTRGDERALDLLTEDLVEAGAAEPELRALQAAVLLASALRAPDAADRHRTALGMPAADPLAAELQREVELARAYQRRELTGRLPPLDAALALLGRCDDPVDRALRKDLGRDLRARPGEYLAWADAAADDPALLAALYARAQEQAASQTPELAADAGALAGTLARAIQADGLRFVPLPAGTLALYRKHVRLKALRAVADGSVALGALYAALREQSGAVQRTAARLEADAALGLVERIARMAC